jgi:hypothetical protein
MTALADGIEHYITGDLVGVYSADPVETRKIHGINEYMHLGCCWKGIIKALLSKNSVLYLQTLYTTVQ